MKYCPVCGYENEDDAAWCINPDCGYVFYTSPENRKTRLMDSVESDLVDGPLIAGRYEIVKELGRGVWAWCTW